MPLWLPFVDPMQQYPEPPSYHTAFSFLHKPTCYEGIYNPLKVLEPQFLLLRLKNSKSLRSFLLNSSP
ncbi:hypothetical protein SLA2020_502840 [Shorea laevis]